MLKPAESPSYFLECSNLLIGLPHPEVNLSAANPRRLDGVVGFRLVDIPCASDRKRSADLRRGHRHHAMAARAGCEQSAVDGAGRHDCKALGESREQGLQDAAGSG